MTEKITTVTLVRHGETAWNAENRYQGHEDIELNELGCSQAHCLAPVMERMDADVILSSDLKRCVRTAEIALQKRPIQLPLVLEPLLRERNYGEWEGLTVPEIEVRYPGMYDRWRRGTPLFRPPGGETREELRLRTTSVLTMIMDRYAGSRVLAFSHGGFIASAISWALGAPVNPPLRLGLYNCAVTVLRHDASGWRLQSLNGVCEA